MFPDIGYIARSPQMADAGLEVLAVARGYSAMKLPHRVEWALGAAGEPRMHPGPIMVLLDTACGLAVRSAMRDRVHVATLHLRFDFPAVARPSLDTFCSAECFPLDDGLAFVRAEARQPMGGPRVAVAQGHFVVSDARRLHATADVLGPFSRTEESSEPQTCMQGTHGAPGDDRSEQAGAMCTYASYLAVDSSMTGGRRQFRLPFQPRLIGNPDVPAIHGGVIAGFAETVARRECATSWQGPALQCTALSVDYLRPGRPQATYAFCETFGASTGAVVAEVRCWQSAPREPIAVGHAVMLRSE